MAGHFHRDFLVHMVPPPQASAEVLGTTLTTQLWQDMVTAGFTVVRTNSTVNNTSLTNATKVLFEATTAVDALAGTYGWRIFMETYGDYNINIATNTPTNTRIQNSGLRFTVGTAEQLTNALVDTGIPNDLLAYRIVPAALDGDSSGAGSNMNVNNGPRIHPDRPMAYKMTATNRGFALAIWMTDYPTHMNRMGVFTIQRGVDNQGVVAVSGQQPLFMVTNISALRTLPTATTGEHSVGGPRTSWFYQVLREKDTIIPSPEWKVYANRTENGISHMSTLISDPKEGRGNSIARFPNKWQQPLISDKDQYLMIFPFGLCTTRFAYSEELDLIAVSKGNAYYNGQEVELEIYGETRTYTALSSNVNSHQHESICVFMLTNAPDL